MKKWLLGLCLLVSLNGVCISEMSLSTTCLIDLTRFATAYFDQLTINELIVNKIVISTTTIKGFDISVYFSPYDDCEKQWIDIITKASSYVYVSCFGITNQNITNALCEVKKRGINVIVCTDKMQAGNKTAKLREEQFKQNNIPYIIKKKQVLEHNKMIAVDDKHGIIGSWNLSGNAQPQDNSIVVFTNCSSLVITIRKAIERIYNRDK